MGKIKGWTKKDTFKNRESWVSKKSRVGVAKSSQTGTWFVMIKNKTVANLLSRREARRIAIKWMRAHPGIEKKRRKVLVPKFKVYSADFVDQGDVAHKTRETYSFQARDKDEALEIANAIAKKEDRVFIENIYWYEGDRPTISREEVEEFLKWMRRHPHG